MKATLIVKYELDVEDYRDLMDESLTLNDVINDLLDDGELELNELPITDWRLEMQEKCGMTKEEFVRERTKIISKMLDNPDGNGIFPTTLAFAELDDLFDRVSSDSYGLSEAQKIRNREPHN
jgi:hypothetical protein